VNAYTAAIFDGPGLPLRLASFRNFALQPGETLVRVTACTICGSDLHTLAGRRPAPTPSILGHEAVGIELATGRRVTWSIMACCGECERCRRGMEQKCERLFKYGHAAHTGAPSGGLSECIVLRPGTTILEVPAGLPDEVVCPANCATATVAACLRVAGDVAGRSVLVQGAGLLGLTAAAMASAAGAAAVHVVEPSAERRQLATQFGATATHPTAETVPPVDIALELSGRSDRLPALRVGGVWVLAGAVFTVPPLPIDPEAMVRGLWRIEGVHNYRPQDLATALNFLAAESARFPFAALVPRTFPLAEVNAALDYVAAARPPRVMIRP
jgi:putative phosphonate catabolism associated alcohol dehydrogenase